LATLACISTGSVATVLATSVGVSVGLWLAMSRVVTGGMLFCCSFAAWASDLAFSTSSCDRTMALP
jgi:hypothetical protein